MGVKEHTPGQIRYFTYFLIFPKDKDVWVDSIPFVHPLDFELKRMPVILQRPELARDLLNKGEASFIDHNGVRHRIVIEDKPRKRRWGKNQGLAS